MPLTSVSSASAYAAVTDLKVWKQWQHMADWLSTDGTRGSESQFNSNAAALTHLKAASGLLEAACLKGGRYTPTDLAALTGNSMELLKRIVCWLAIASMSRFKTRTKGDDEEIHWAQDVLQALADGERIFAFQETMDAGIPDNVQMAPPNSQQEADRVSVQAERLFGQRLSNRLS